MLFKKKEDQYAFSTSMDAPASINKDPVNEKDRAIEAKTQDGQNIQPTTDIVYPSGLKLGLLMVSMFVGMFLVALVRYVSKLSVFRFH